MRRKEVEAGCEGRRAELYDEDEQRVDEADECHHPIPTASKKSTALALETVNQIETWVSVSLIPKATRT